MTMKTTNAKRATSGNGAGPLPARRRPSRRAPMAGAKTIVASPAAEAPDNAPDLQQLVPAEVQETLRAAGHVAVLEVAALPKVRIGIDDPVYPCELVPAALEDVEAIADLQHRALALCLNPHLAKEGERAEALFLSVRDTFFGGAIAFSIWQQRNLPLPPQREKLKRSRPPKAYHPPLPWLFSYESLQKGLAPAPECAERSELSTVCDSTFGDQLAAATCSADRLGDQREEL